MISKINFTKAVKLNFLIEISHGKVGTSHPLHDFKKNVYLIFHLKKSYFSHTKQIYV